METPTIYSWIQRKSLLLAIKEANIMKVQYDKIYQFSLANDIPDYIVLEARRYYTEASSFVVSFRNRGYNWACMESSIQRPILSLLQLQVRQYIENSDKQINTQLRFEL